MSAVLVADYVADYVVTSRRRWDLSAAGIPNAEPQLATG